MKITVYTTTNCQFSKTEKEYLNANKFAFEEKNIDANKAFLTEMMTIGNNFAGTPVTKVEKDDGTSVVLKGFTKDEFDVALGLKKEEPVKPEVDKAVPGVIAESKPPTAGSFMPPTAPVKDMPPVISTPTPPKTEDKPLNDVLSKLQTNIGEATTGAAAGVAIPPAADIPGPEPVQPQAPVPPPVTPSTPAIPPESPALPDFPTK